MRNFVMPLDFDNAISLIIAGNNVQIAMLYVGIFEGDD